MCLQNKNENLPSKLNSLLVRLTQVLAALSEHNRLEDPTLIGLKTWFPVVDRHGSIGKKNGSDCEDTG